MAWNRKRTIDFCNEEIFPQVHFSQWIGLKGELMDVVKIVEQYRRTHGFVENLKAKVVDGFLYLNNDPVGRIAMKKQIAANNYNDGAYYWEGRILARQGM